MATVVNARDVLLQATSPRVASVAASSNITVDPSQVTGLGLVIEGTKLLDVNATTQTFQIAKTGVVSPSFTTLTPVFRNITGTPVVTVISGSIFPAPVYIGGAITINYTDLLSDSATVRVSVVDVTNGLSYYDDTTIVKVREGIDSLSGFLTNENITLPADVNGNVVSYANAAGTFKVFQGTNDITGLCAFSIVSNPTGLTFTIDPVTGDYLLNGGYPPNAELCAVVIRATFGSALLDKVFTISKSKAGGDGKRGSRTYYIALAGGQNTFSDSLATATVNAAGGVILNDTVTQFNDSVKFSETRFWDGAGWAIVNAIVDGNLLVSGTVGASKITVNVLTAIQASLGTATIDANGYLRSASAVSFAAGAGFWMGYDVGTYKFRIGDPAAHNLAWNGSSLVIKGELNGGSYTGYNFVTAGLTGFHLSQYGLIVGDYLGGKGFWMDATNGNIQAPNFSIVGGTVKITGSIMGGAFSAYAWPAAGAGNIGFYLGPEGLLLGNANNGKYCQIEANGNFYLPGLSVINGALTVSGQLSSGSISVGNGYMTFYDPLQSNLEIRTSAQSTLSMHQDTGAYDGTYGTYFPTIVWGANSEFTTNQAGTPVNRRIRVGTVRFNVIATGQIDEHFTLWRRINGGAWAAVATLDELQASYGTGAMSWSEDIAFAAGWWIDWGITTGNTDFTYSPTGQYADPGKRIIYNGALTVTAVNF